MINAHGLAPTLPEAAERAAHAWQKRGKRRKAEKVLETAWAAHPHPALADSYDDVRSTQAREARARRLLKFSEMAPDGIERRLLRAAQKATLDRPREAQALLEPLLTMANPPGRALRLHGEIVAQITKDPEAARPWMERAFAAPKEKDLRSWRPDQGFDFSVYAVAHRILDTTGLKSEEIVEDDAAAPAAIAGPPRTLLLAAPEEDLPPIIEDEEAGVSALTAGQSAPAERGQTQTTPVDIPDEDVTPADRSKRDEANQTSKAPADDAGMPADALHPGVATGPGAPPPERKRRRRS
jgi:HemY protein